MSRLQWDGAWWLQRNLRGFGISLFYVQFLWLSLCYGLEWNIFSSVMMWASKSGIIMLFQLQCKTCKCLSIGITSNSTKNIQFWGLRAASVLLASNKMIEQFFLIHLRKIWFFFKFWAFYGSCLICNPVALRNHAQLTANQIFIQLLLDNHKVALSFYFFIS